MAPATSRPEGWHRLRSCGPAADERTEWSAHLDSAGSDPVRVRISASAPESPPGSVMDDSTPVVLEVRASYDDWREAADAPYQDGGPLPPDGRLGRVLGKRPFGVGGTATITISEGGIVIRQGLDVRGAPVVRVLRALRDRPTPRRQIRADDLRAPAEASDERGGPGEGPRARRPPRARTSAGDAAADVSRLTEAPFRAAAIGADDGVVRPPPVTKVLGPSLSFVHPRFAAGRRSTRPPRRSTNVPRAGDGCVAAGQIPIRASTRPSAMASSRAAWSCSTWSP